LSRKFNLVPRVSLSHEVAENFGAYQTENFENARIFPISGGGPKPISMSERRDPVIPFDLERLHYILIALQEFNYQLR